MLSIENKVDDATISNCILFYICNVVSTLCDWPLTRWNRLSGSLILNISLLMLFLVLLISDYVYKLRQLLFDPALAIQNAKCKIEKDTTCEMILLTKI